MRQVTVSQVQTPRRIGLNSLKNPGTENLRVLFVFCFFLFVEAGRWSDCAEYLEMNFYAISPKTPGHLAQRG